MIHLLLCEMSQAAFGGGAANSRWRPARLRCCAVADPGGGRAGWAVVTKGVSSCDWATLTAGAPGAASSCPVPGGGLAFLWHADGVGIEIEKLAAKPTGGRSDASGVGVGLDGDVGGERYRLLFHGHTRYRAHTARV